MGTLSNCDAVLINGLLPGIWDDLGQLMLLKVN